MSATRIATPDLSDDQIDRLRTSLAYLVDACKQCVGGNKGYDLIMETGTANFLECEDILKEIGDQP